MPIDRLAFVITLFLVGLSSTQSRADERLKGLACRSVHLQYRAPASVAFYNEITVESSAKGTYFSVCGWNKGYFGLQELWGGKKLIIFSVWDSKQNNPNAVEEDMRTKLVYKDEKTRIKRFGGEGTGGQSFFDYDWKKGQNYRFLVTCKVKKDRTEYGGHFYVPEEKAWKHLITFSTVTGGNNLGTGGNNLGGYYSFVEDFRRNRVSATQQRKAKYGNGWVKPIDKDWVPLSRARFTADRNPVMNINAGVDEDRYFLVTGGKTENTDTKLRQIMTLPKESFPRRPDDLPVD